LAANGGYRTEGASRCLKSSKYLALRTEPFIEPAAAIAGTVSGSALLGTPAFSSEFPRTF
jgi:hypothetical protein